MDGIRSQGPRTRAGKRFVRHWFRNFISRTRINAPPGLKEPARSLLVEGSNSRMDFPGHHSVVNKVIESVINDNIQATRDSREVQVVSKRVSAGRITRSDYVNIAVIITTDSLGRKEVLNCGKSRRSAVIQFVQENMPLTTTKHSGRAEVSFLQTISGVVDVRQSISVKRTDLRKNYCCQTRFTTSEYLLNHA